jgi:hypothetical protein
MDSNDAVTKVLEQVTRWDAPSSSTLPEPDGDLVLYDDATWAATEAYEVGQRDMLARCVKMLDDHHPRCTDPCELCAEWDGLRNDLQSLAVVP